MLSPPESLRQILDGSFDASLIVLSNGQIWHMNDSTRGLFALADGDEVGGTHNITSISTHISFLTSSHVALTWNEVIRSDSFDYGKKIMAGVVVTTTNTDREGENTRATPVRISLVRMTTAPETGHLEECYFCLYLKEIATTPSRVSSPFEEKLNNLTITNNETAVDSTILKLVLDASFHALFVINEEGIIQLVNEKSCEVFGWSKNEFLGSNIHIIMPAEVAASHDQYLKNYLKTGIKKMIGTQREVTAQRKDGSTFPCVLGLSEVSKDSGLICGFIRDLTSEKKILSEVEENHKLMLKIIDSSFHALLVINEKGIIQMVSERSTKVLGWTKEEFVGQNIKMIMPHEHAHQHDDYLKRYIATGFKRMIGKEREVEAKRKDGYVLSARVFQVVPLKSCLYLFALFTHLL